MICEKELDGEHPRTVHKKKMLTWAVTKIAKKATAKT